MNSEKYIVCINCGLVVDQCICCYTAPYFTILEPAWGSKWEMGNSIKITIEERKPMQCTEDELREWIETLAEKVDDVEETVLALGRAINSVSNLSILEKRGIRSFIEDIDKQIESYKGLSADVKDFTLKER